MPVHVKLLIPRLSHPSSNARHIEVWWKL